MKHSYEIKSNSAGYLWQCSVCFKTRPYPSEPDNSKCLEILLKQTVRGLGYSERKDTLAATLRYRIMSDDSGHEYFVPVDEAVLFELWLETFEDDWDPEFRSYDGPDYGNNRIDGRFTFTDPKVN